MKEQHSIHVHTHKLDLITYNILYCLFLYPYLDLAIGIGIEMGMRMGVNIDMNKDRNKM